MANLKEEPKWEDGIYQYETTDPLQGGEDGIDNVQGRQLANRTQWLKEKVEGATAKTESGNEAANAYAAGEQFFLGGKLYTAKKTISAGDALTPGENCEEAGTTGAQLAAHKADKQNPHGVTAAQVGAYTKGETDEITGTLANEVGSVHATALMDESKSRSLLDVLGIRAEHSDAPATEAEAKACIKALHDKLEAGEFSGFRIGDYLDLASLTVDGTTYTWNAAYKNLRLMIMGFNTYKHIGDCDEDEGEPENKKDHILFQFRNCVLTRRFNATNTNDSYFGSELSMWLNDKFKAGLVSALGDYLYTVNRMLPEHEDWNWQRDTVFLPTEPEVWGRSIWSNNQYELASMQWPAYRDSPIYRVKRHNGSRMWWWEASPYENNAVSFCNVSAIGNAYSHIATGAGGVAPAFCVA